MDLSINTLIFKKGDKKNSANYMRVFLQEEISQPFTGIIAGILRNLIPISAEQQGLANRSITYAIYTIHQIDKKAIEYNVPAYPCFVGLT